MAKYITGRELLDELHKCKNTYCTYIHPSCSDFDLIIAEGGTIDPDQVATLSSDLGRPAVVRKMTHEHIPEDPTRRRWRGNILSPNGLPHRELPFPPFKHYLYQDGALIEVGRSHWEGDFQTGHFTVTKGKITNRLALMFMKMTERYASKYNFRNYSYRDEMIAHSMTELCKVGLKFDESKSNNPFAYYTQIITNHFIKIINNEKTQQMVRDDLLEKYGAKPSHSRQMQGL